MVVSYSIWKSVLCFPRLIVPRTNLGCLPFLPVPDLLNPAAIA